MAAEDSKDKKITGKTYSLYGLNTETDQYYSLIEKLADLFLEKCPDEKKLLVQVQKAGSKGSFLKKRSGMNIDKSLVSFIRKTLKESNLLYGFGRS